MTQRPTEASVDIYMPRHADPWQLRRLCLKGMQQLYNCSLNPLYNACMLADHCVLLQQSYSARQDDSLT